MSFGKKTTVQDEWESVTQEPLNDRPSCLDNAVLCDFTRYRDPLLARRKILQVAEWSKPKEFTSITSKTYHQALLSAALVTGTEVTKTASVYCSQNDNLFPIVLKTGASVSVTPMLKDLIGPLRPCATAVRVVLVAVLSTVPYESLTPSTYMFSKEHILVLPVLHYTG
jgi:hypothetical protein